MSNDNPGYKDWKWLEMDKSEQETVALVKKIFNANAAKHGVEGYELDIKKASLTIDREEGFSGAFHKLAGGKPFYRISITAPANSGMDGVMTFMMLSQVFATSGGASVSMGNPAVMTLDRADDMMQPAIDVAQLLPQAVAMVRKGK